VAVGAELNDGNASGAGQVHVIQLVNREWVPIGSTINGRAAEEGLAFWWPGNCASGCNSN